MSNFLLSINNLNVEFTAKGKKIKVLSDLSFNLGYGETLGIVGESGCGKYDCIIYHEYDTKSSW